MNQNKDNRGKYIFWIFIPCILALVIQYIASIVVLEGSVAYVLGTFKGATWDELMDCIKEGEEEFKRGEAIPWDVATSRLNSRKWTSRAY